MTFIKPMLARPGEFPADETDWFLEPKHDGMRAIIVRTVDGVEIYSRTGKSQEGKCPHIERSFMDLPSGTILDGELALIENTVEIDGRSVPVVSFNKTMRIMGSNPDKAVVRQKEFGNISFIAFDVIKHDGDDFSDEDQSSRTKWLKSQKYDYMVHNPAYHTGFPHVYDELVAAGIEGAIIKNKTQKYEAGKRAKGWLKLKVAQTFDVVITGFTEGQGKYEGQIGAIEFSAYMPDGTLNYVGRCSGMTDEERLSFTESAESILSGSPVVIEVKANDMVGSGEYRTPRHPQFVCVRQDKNPEDCLMGQFKM